MKLVTLSTYIKFYLLYRNGTKTNTQLSSIQGLPSVLAQVTVSNVELDRVYSQWARVVSGCSWYRSVKRSASASRARGGDFSSITDNAD